jgi:hypothetical protein
MPRVIVTTGGPSPDPGDSVLLDERVASVHLSDRHAAEQLIERLAWAIGDAERVEAETSAVSARTRRDAHPRRGASHAAGVGAAAIAA